MSEFCSKWADHADDCGVMFRPSAGTLADRTRAGLTTQRCGKSLVGGAPLGEQAQQPPEESLCGEEENLVTLNDFQAEYFPDEQGNPVTPPPPLPADRWGRGSEAWLRHCQQVGRNRCRAYDEAFGLVEAQLAAFVSVWPELVVLGAEAEGVVPPTPKEVGGALAFGEGFLGFVRHLRAVTANVTGGKR